MFEVTVDDGFEHVGDNYEEALRIFGYYAGSKYSVVLWEDDQLIKESHPVDDPEIRLKGWDCV